MINYLIKKPMLLMLILLGLNLNSVTSFFSIILLFYIGIRNVGWTLKCLSLSFILAVLNPMLFYSSFGSLRTILNIILMILIISHSNVQKNLNKEKFIKIIIIYCLYIIFSSLIISWLPLVSLFKAVYFSLGFISIIIGMISTPYIDWIDYFKKYYAVIIWINTILIIFPVGYSTNKVALNGIFNNPNMLGIFCTLALAIFLYDDITKSSKKNKMYIIVLIIQIFLSKSRTSIFISLFLLIYYIILKTIMVIKGNRVLVLKYFIKSIILSIIIFIIYICNRVVINEYFIDIILKGQTSNSILVSRDNQITQFLNDFNSNPLFGVGFGVDNAQDRLTSLQFSFSYPVERGNIVFAILAETGIIGLILFSTLLISIVIRCKNNNTLYLLFSKNILIFAAILISFGEMTFFSGNSIGILQWFLIGIYVSNRK